jgi:hypothetical protein
MGIDACCYSMNVTCDFCTGVKRSPAREQFVGNNSSEAHKARSAAGWKYYPAQGKIKCPACAKRRRLDDTEKR